MAPLTLPHELDLGPVKMKISKVTGQYSEPQIDATFSEGLTPAFSWAVQESYAVDRHGNYLRPSEVCRNERTFRVVGRVQKFDGASPSARFDFVLPRRAVTSRLE